MTPVFVYMGPARKFCARRRENVIGVAADNRAFVCRIHRIIFSSSCKARDPYIDLYICRIFRSLSHLYMLDPLAGRVFVV
jgi:hypothetical protein